MAFKQSALLPSEHRTERVRAPVPHCLEHADHGPVTQLGHLWVLHFCVCDKTGHAAPPKADCVMTVRVDVCEPPPQVAVHLDQADHADTVQAMGHL